MNTEEKQPKLRYGTVNFEKRRHPRFNVDLPIEYFRTDSLVQHGRAVNASEGGLLIYLPEPMEIGQRLRMKIFFPLGSEIISIDAVTEVVWLDIHLGEGWGDYRTGIAFVDLSLENLNKLKDFLRSLL
jgi:hypothetical protein